MLKIPTQNNKLGIAERARVRKVLTQDYGLGESFFKEMDGSVKRVCKNQNDIKTYYILSLFFEKIDKASIVPLSKQGRTVRNPAMNKYRKNRKRAGSLNFL